MVNNQRGRAIWLIPCLFLLSLAAQGGTLGPTCGSCFGGIYTVDAALLDCNVGGLERWQIAYTLDLRGVNEPGVSFVSQIAIKVVEGDLALNRYALVDNPTNQNWNVQTGQLSNNGCTGSGSGWLCLAYAGPNATSNMLTGTPGSVYTWRFTIDINPGTLASVGSIKANFDPANGKLLSEKIQVPEGVSGELPLLLSGLGFLAFWSRRYSTKTS